MQGNVRTTDAIGTQTGCVSSSDELKQDRKGPTEKIPHRDGYDWNKRGKLVELRKRHLARKFLKIWILKTFGRIPPHTAKTQHQIVVLRRAFEGWKDEWWTSRKEWCLTTVANCHYKYYLYNLAFQRWQTFVSLQKKKKSKVQQSMQFAHRQLMRLAWNRWNISRELRMKKKLLQSVLELKKLKTLQSAWNIWQARLQQHQNLQITDKLVLKQRGQASQQRILSKHCKLWWDCLEEAEGKHFQPLREVSLTMHSTFLLRSHFNHWRKRLTERGCVQELQHQVDDCFAKHIVSSCFKFWVELTLQRSLQKQRKHKADIYNQQRLCTWVFYTWCAQTKKHKDQMLSERLAVLHEEQSRLQRAWRCWKGKIKNKVKQTASIQMYLDTLSCTTVTMWKDINTEIQDRRHQEQPACFQSDPHVRKWAVDECEQSKTLIARRDVTPSAVSAYGQQREPLTRFQMSPNQVGLLQCFRQWRKEAAHARTEKINMERARWHHESKLLTKAMKAWNEHHNQCHENKVVNVMKRQGIFLLRLKMYQKFFDLWKVKLQHRRREAELRERALWHWSLTLQAKVLYGWRWWVTEQHKKQEQAAGAAQVDRDEPPKEDLKSCLTSAANTKDLKACPTEDSQEQGTFWMPKRSQRVHGVVRSCALHWKQKALSKPHTERELKEGPQKKKSVTFSCTTPKLTVVPSPDSVEEDDNSEELRKLLANRTHRRQPRRPRGLLESPLANLHKQLAVTDTAAAPEPVLSLNSSTADLLLGESSASSLLQSPVYSDVLVGESGKQTDRVDSASSLTKELLRIQQDMNSYQQNRRQLRTWKKLREVLQSWIQTSGRDDQSEKNTVRQEIKELEGRIDRLSTELAKQKPKMLLYAERIQRLQAALTCHSVLTAPH